MDRSVESSSLFPFERWGENVDALAAEYATAEPFPHARLENFLDFELAKELESEFPRPDDTTWTQYKHFNENKLGKTDRSQFPAKIGKVMDTLNSPEFVSWPSTVTGIPGLMPDPMLEGGGMHQTESGGFLNIHADFTMHHYHENWRRRCNVIVYLNTDWDPNWGGGIELWDTKMEACVVRVTPHINHAVIFNTTDDSYHGYPDPITCPEDRTRKSPALYYYTVETDESYVAKSTNYKAAPADSLTRRILIWFDKKALQANSKLKGRLGFSDEAVSKVLGLFFRNRK